MQAKKFIVTILVFLVGNYFSKNIKFSLSKVLCTEQPPIGVPRKSSSKNMQQIYRSTPIHKSNFNKAAEQLY